MTSVVRIYKGADAIIPFRIESGRFVHLDVESIEDTAPLRIKITGHGMPDTWQCVVLGGGGGLYQMQPTTWPPKASSYLPVLKIDDDTLELNSVDVSDTGPICEAIRIAYKAPYDLSDVTGGSLVVIDPKTKQRIESFPLTIDGSTQSVTLNISDTDTQAILYSDAICRVELTKSSGVIEPVGEEMRLLCLA